MGKKREKVEFRYYELPQDVPVIARMGAEWKQIYGRSTSDKHFHNLLEIGYCHYGTGELILGEEARPFAGSMVSVIPPNYLHNTKSDEGVIAYWEYLFVDTEKFLTYIYGGNREQVKEFTKHIHKEARFVSKEEMPRFTELIKEILEELGREEALYMESVKGLLLAALMEVVRMSSPKEEKAVQVRPGSARIAPALFYISDNYGKKLRIEELAQVCHMSETHFRRLFVKSMNMTPVEYINLIRVRMACELLSKTECSMEEAAERTGFETASTFNRNFKKLLEISPYQWKIHPENYENKLLHYKVSAYRGW